MHHGEFADDTKKGDGTADIWLAIERDLDRLDKRLEEFHEVQQRQVQITAPEC